MTRDATEAVARFTRVLGRPICTPRMVTGTDGHLERAQHRVFRWPCPICDAGRDDPIWRPFFVDSDGRIGAGCCNPSTKQIAAKLRELTDVADLLDALETGALV